MRTFLFFVALGTVLRPALAAAECGDTVAAVPGRGLCFQAGTLPAASAAGSALMVWLGGGYDLSDRLSLEVLFQTGHLHTAPAPRRPIDGTLLLGGASLELCARLFDVGPGMLIAGGGGGLFTALKQSGSGYNGSGASLFAGAAFPVFPGFEAAPVLRCGWWTWRNGVGPGVEPFDAFTQFWYGAGLTLTFRPRI